MVIRVEIKIMHNPSQDEFGAEYSSRLALCKQKAAALYIQKWYRKWKRACFFNLKQQLIEIRTSAAVAIQKVARGWLARRALKPLLTQKIIKWEHGGYKVYVRGSFTSPPWQEQIEMPFHPYLNYHITTILSDRNINSGEYLIKFQIDGEWKCNGNLPITLDEMGNYNNFLIVQPISKGLHRSLRLRSISYEILPNQSIVISNPNSPILLTRSCMSSGSPHKIGLYKTEPNREIKLLMGSYMIAKPRNRFSSVIESADAFFFDTKLQAFAIADGVSEWGGYGLNPSDFSRELIKRLHECISEDTIDRESLEQAICNAYYKVGAFGSSTILAGVCKDSMLHTVSLGDSGYIVLRPREFAESLITVYRSSEQQHSFNCPYQLTHLPTEQDYERLINSGYSRLITLLKQRNRSYDSIVDSVQEIIPLRKGDIVIVGTDGLYDNLYDQDIINITEKVYSKMKSEELVSILPKLLVEEALNKSWDNSYRSPF
jgi:serine/threonine protein phosphatase PrpC